MLYQTWTVDTITKAVFKNKSKAIKIKSTVFKRTSQMSKTRQTIQPHKNSDTNKAP